MLWRAVPCCVRYALRNTLVAKDLEQASRIAYGSRDRRFARVVTVAGQLIAGEAGGGVVSGTLTMGRVLFEALQAVCVVLCAVCNSLTRAGRQVAAAA
jgi:hypothetical protein